MLKTFKAFLQNGRLEWIEDHPSLENERLQVYVTLLEGDTEPVLKTGGQKMAELLQQLAATYEGDGIDPVQWQQEMRCDRSLPGR
ncbi:hypothetical protein VB712_16220 [Spirulina sp. CCNP1310]|uniref:hypothetical protein n=1 Tax=Spirulina sp. CCNP1310 TaxID=3110249 RepID=UPI002B1EC64C|nr:hypothetical protein [Spirulina sp. CCNP1310]MEA5420779.1 hypothetical protein [Spirulina sp. CCNP1310]